MLLTRQQLDTMMAHAASEPHEVCGVLLGYWSPACVVVTVQPALNVAPDPQRHFVLDAATLLRADRAARDMGQDIVGFYHSHPQGAALPSNTDRRWAWPELVTLIIAIDKAGLRYLCAWWLQPGSFRPEPIRLL